MLTAIAAVAAETLRPDFGSGLYEGSPIGIPITVVPGSQRRVRVSFLYADESDRGPYPIPAGVKLEGGRDRHALIVDRDGCRLYELYALERRDGRWRARERSGTCAPTASAPPAGCYVAWPIPGWITTSPRACAASRRRRSYASTSSGSTFRADAR